MPIFENKKLISSLRIFRPISRLILVLFPNLELELKQNQTKIKPVDYTAVSFFMTFSQSLLIALLLLIVFYKFQSLNSNNVLIIIGITLFSFMFMLFYFMSLPKLYLLQRINKIDRSLLFALRHMHIKVRSGIPLFDSMVGIAYGDYGLMSKEFQKAVKDIESGESQITALEKLSFYNPSPFFQKFIWQITNSLRSGTDIARTLEVVVNSLEDYRYLQVKAFGSRLSPIALMYIMFTIVVPSLGTTFLAVFATFIGGKVNEVTFMMSPVIILLSNLFFMNIIQKSRPFFEGGR